MSDSKVVFPSKGIGELIDSLGELTSSMQKAIESGSQALMKAGADKVRKSYVASGGKTGDYVYRSISYYGKPLVTGSDFGPSKMGYWNSIGVYDIQSVRSERAERNSKTPEKELNAAQIAYWIEFGTQRLRSGARKPNNFNEDAFDPKDLINVAPNPFLSSSAVTDVAALEKAFIESFNDKMKELGY